MQLGASGGFPAYPEEAARGLLLEVSLFCSLLFFPCGFLHSYPVFFIFQGLDLLKRVGSLWEEAHKLEMEAQHLKVEGLEKIEESVAGSEVEGFYGLLRGAMSHSSISPAPPPHKNVCHTLSATISHLPPQGSTGPDVPDPADQAMKAVSPAVPPASEEAIPANMQPLYIQLGALNKYTGARLRAARRVHQTSHATICAHICKVHLGMVLVCPSCSKSFFNPDTSSATRKAILISRIRKKLSSVNWGIVVINGMG